MQAIETVQHLGKGSSSPAGYQLYKIIHPDGSFTVRNLRPYSTTAFRGSFDPNPEVFSADHEAELATARAIAAILDSLDAI